MCAFAPPDRLRGCERVVASRYRAGSWRTCERVRISSCIRMYVCLYVCMPTVGGAARGCWQPMHLRDGPHFRICVCVYICMYLCIRAWCRQLMQLKEDADFHHIYMCVCVCIYIYIYICMYVCMYVCMCIYIYLCMCVYI